MDYLEKCNEIAEAYADKVASRNGFNYDDAYDQAMDKCIRKHKEESVDDETD